MINLTDLTVLQIFPLMSAIFMLILGVFVLKSKQSIIGGLFFLITLVFAIWTFGTFMMFVSIGDEKILFWDRFIYLGVVFMPAFQYHFSLAMTVSNKIRKNLLRLAYTLSFIFLIFSQSDYFVKGIFRYKWGVHSEAQILHHFFLAFFFFYIFIIVYNFYKHHQSSDILTEKRKMKLMIASFAILNVVGGIGYLPAYKISIYSPVSLLAPVVFSIIIAYSIVRYRLMDLRVVFKKIFIQIGIILFTYLILAIWLFYVLSDFSYVRNIMLVTGFFVSIFIVIAIPLIKNFLEKTANKYFFLSLYNYQETIKELSTKLNHYTNLDRIINSIVFTIKKTMQLDRAGVLLIEEKENNIRYRVAKVVGFNESNGISLVKDSFLTRYLKESQVPLVRDELAILAEDTRTMEEKESFYKLGVLMKKIEASLCLPLLSNGKLIGIIVLGSKISGNAYSKEDLELLETLSSQAGIAVDNAILYQKVQDFNKTLQDKINEQTKDIKTKARELEEKNKSMGELLEMKSDFLRVVNHQLNTPISIMKNSLFMIKDKTFSTEKGLEFIEAGLKRVDETINDFWSAFALEGEKIKMNREETDIEKIIKDLIKEKNELKIIIDRGLKIKIKKSDFKLPAVFCDGAQITQALSNLLENAICYTPKGEIKFSFAEDEDDLKISIADTGSGISEEDQKNLFKKFSRGSTSVRFHTNGSGLGLYIARKIAEGNDGKLELVKTEANKGSVFCLALPIFKGQPKEDFQEGDEKKIKLKIKKGSKNKQKKIILFIEDEKKFADIYKKYFTKKGYDFKVLYGIENAVKMAEKIKPDLILTDIIIPQKNSNGSIANTVAEQGWNFIADAKNNKEINNIPIFVFTNLNSNEDKKKAEKLGVSGYILKKETNPEKLIEILTKFK